MKYTKSIIKQYLSILFAMLFFYASAQNPFIENKGQFPKEVISKTILPSGVLFFEQARLTYAFYDGSQLADIHDKVSKKNSIDAHAYSVSFSGANTTSTSQLLEQSSFYENYFLGSKSNWATDVRSYKKYVQQELYTGVDLVYFIKNDQLKYEFIVAKGANPSEIRMQYKGVTDVFIKAERLLVQTTVNMITEHKPYAYQIIEGEEVVVSCSYKLRKNTVSFNFPNGYNKNYELVVDPILEFSTYSGSTADNFGYTATYDDFGFLYSGSTAFGMGYPTTLGAYQITYADSSGGTDIAITKYDTSGTFRIYSTYLGGSKSELPHSMIVNNVDELFIFGTTGSANFPVTNGAYQTTFEGGNPVSVSGLGVNLSEGSDIFVAKLSANGGSLLASTFVGGTDNDGLNLASKLRYNYADEVRGEIDIDQYNNIYIATCTQSSDFPIVNGFQSTLNGNQEGCIVKMDNQLSSIIWSSYLGGTNADAIYSLALDKAANVYVTGGTTSDDFITTPNAYQTAYLDSIKADAFITLIAANGSQVLKSSYYGSEEYDQSYFVELGGTEEVYLFGQTKAQNQTLVANATYFQSGAGQFIAVFSKDLDTISRATVVGTGNGTPDISPTAFLVDVCDKIYISGWGSGTAGGPLSTLGLDTTANAYQPTTDGNDFYLMVMDEALGSLIYATFFGGSQSAEHVDGGTSRFDKKGIIYQSVCAGCGGNSDFPIEPLGAVSAINGSSNCNNGVFKFDFDYPIVIANFNAPYISCDSIINFQDLSNTITNATHYWNFGDGSSSSQTDPVHSYALPGLYTVSLVVSSPGACNVSDTITQDIHIKSVQLDAGKDTSYCNTPVLLTAQFSSNVISVLWSSNRYFTDTIALTPSIMAGHIAIFYVKVTDGFCEQIDSVEVKMENINFEIVGALDLCEGDSVHLSVNNLHPTIPLTSYIWSPTPSVYSSDSSAISDYQDTSMWYSVIGENIDGCIMKDSVFVNNFSNPVIDSLWIDDNVVFRGETTHINIETAASFNWLTLNSTANKVALTPTYNQCYVVEIFNIYNCFIRDSVCVSVIDVFCDFSNIKVPTAFSPNEDNVNDTYFIEDKDAIIKEFKLEIFNRLGQKVFATTNKYDEWDGIFRGVKLNPQVFDFYLELRCVDDRTLFKKGNLTLIR